MPPTLNDIRQTLAPYGVTLVDDEGPWNIADATRIQNMIVSAGQRLHDFALLIFDLQTVGAIPDVFNQLFGPLPFKRGQTDTRPGTKFYGFNSGVDITLYNNAFFNGSSHVFTLPFNTTFTTEFLILHEICHKRKFRVWPKTGVSDVDSYYLQTSKPIVQRLAAKLGLPATSEELDPSSSRRTASAGFQQAARSKPNVAEFATDALANWLMDSFTNDADGYGDLRRAQMNELVTKLLYSVFGGPPAVAGAEAAVAVAAAPVIAADAMAAPVAVPAVSSTPTFALRGMHGEEGAKWLRDNGKQGWALETVFANGDFTHPLSPDFSDFAANNIHVIVRWNNSFATSDGGSGTFPTKDKYDDFINWCVASIRNSKGVWGHIIGNEPNNPTEHPNPQNSILPEDVARIFNGVRQQLPNSDIRLSPAGVDPTTNAMGIFPQDYWRRVLANLKRADFFALHAYSYGSDQAPNTKVFFDTMPKHYFSFKMWQPLADIIYTEFPERRRIPLIITETNHLYVRGSNNKVAGWDDDAGGAKWIKDVYDMVASWNRGPGAQYVHGICLYRYKGAGDPRTISNKANLLEALSQSGDNPL